MEQQILGGSYQIRVVKRPLSLDLERRRLSGQSSKFSQNSHYSEFTEEPVNEYRDGIFEDLYDEVYEKVRKMYI